MKRKTIQPHDGIEPVSALAAALGALRTETERREFLRDLCTPAELEALTDRWRVVAPLWRGEPYRDIHESTSVSVTTIGRVARFLAFGHGGYRVAAERLYGPGRPTMPGAVGTDTGDSTAARTRDGTVAR